MCNIRPSWPFNISIPQRQPTSHGALRLPSVGGWHPLYPMSHLPHPSLPRSLYKLNSWSPDSNSEEAWLRRKGCRNRRSRSLTDEELDELNAYIELGFVFDSLEMDQSLSDTIPAYGLYHAINKNYNSTVGPVEVRHSFPPWKPAHHFRSSW